MKNSKPVLVKVDKKKVYFAVLGYLEEHRGGTSVGALAEKLLVPQEVVKGTLDILKADCLVWFAPQHGRFPALYGRTQREERKKRSWEKV